MRAIKIQFPLWLTAVLLIAVSLVLYFDWRKSLLDQNLFLLTIIVSWTLETVSDLGATAKRDKELVLLPMYVATVIALWFSWNSEGLLWRWVILICCVFGIDLGLDRLFTEKLKKDRKLVVRVFLMILTWLFFSWIAAVRALHHDYRMALLLALFFFSIIAWALWKKRRKPSSAGG
jgi:hypothetical protein